MNLNRYLQSWWSQLAFLVGVFAVVTLVAEAFGATNLGTAMTFGQIAFAIATVWLIVKGP